MHQLKLHMVGLIAALVSLFSVGRLAEATFDVASTPASVQLLTAGVVVWLIVVRSSYRIPSGVLVAAVAVVCVGSRAFAHDPTVVESGAGAAVTAAEIALASLAVMLAVRVARGLNQFEETIANVTLDDLSSVTTLAAARDDISIEMSRARRHERPLTVTVLSFDPRSVNASLHEIVRDVQQRMMQRYIMSGLARVAAQTTRRGDIVVQDPVAHRVIVLSPESSPEQLDALTHRLQNSAYRTLGIPIRFGTAGFPDTALTFEDLVAHASGDAASATATEMRDQWAPVRAGVGLEGVTASSMRTLYRDVDDITSVTPRLDEHAQAVHGD